MSKGLREEIEEIFDGENERFVYTDVINDTVNTILSIINRESNKAVIEELEKQNQHYLSKGGHLLLYDDENGNPVYLSERLVALKEQIGEE